MNEPNFPTTGGKHWTIKFSEDFIKKYELRDKLNYDHLLKHEEVFYIRDSMKNAILRFLGQLSDKKIEPFTITFEDGNMCECVICKRRTIAH